MRPLCSSSTRIWVRKGGLCLLQHRALSQTSRKCAASQPRILLSKLWAPTGALSAVHSETGHDKLVRGGFLRQSHSGLFQMLPLGLRVQQKIESLLDKHMQSIGASKLSLSTISSEELWRKSGRLEGVSSELFRFQDRRETPLLLSPTHEEEITSLVTSSIKSYKDLPLRLYQTTRKYRDELRPRHGLLRSREFLMKDLYTFDVSQEDAIQTYQEVSAAYRAFFADLKLPVLVAEASSGDMGGDYSHEYHLANAIGEDTVASCNTCTYAANDEVAQSRPSSASATSDAKLDASRFAVWRGISQDGETLINAWYPRQDNSSDAGLNIHAVRNAVPELDASIGNPLKFWKKALEGKSQPRLINVVDSRLSSKFDSLKSELPMLPEGLEGSYSEQTSISSHANGDDLNLVPLLSGDGCPRCETGSLKIDRALELAHTFYLGTRYSVPLNAYISLPQNGSQPTPIEMGCYGVGISRILGAVAEHKADSKGLAWPRAIAPYDVVLIPTSGVNEQTMTLYDKISSETPFEIALDDRRESFGWKMRDADVTGYPVAVVLGKAWRERGLCEVQCRGLGVKKDVLVEQLGQHLHGLLEKL